MFNQSIEPLAEKHLHRNKHVRSGTQEGLSPSKLVSQNDSSENFVVHSINHSTSNLPSGALRGSQSTHCFAPRREEDLQDTDQICEQFLKQTPNKEASI